MPVTSLTFEQTLQKLSHECRDPKEGLFGPGSICWQINRETATLAGAGRALLLQISHPIVANALQFESDVQSDLAGRLRSTSMGVLKMLFGDRDTAIQGARVLYRVHDSIRGEIRIPGPNHPAGMRYTAVDAEALFWVHASLVDSAVRAYEMMVRPLTRLEKEAYYQDSCRFALLYGIPADYLPYTWHGFQERFAEIVANDLVVTDWAHTTGNMILETRNSLLRPLLEYQKLFTAYQLPESLRQGFGLTYGPTQRLTLAASLPAMRASYLALPPHLRYWPAYLDAKRRLRGKGPDRIGRALEEWVINSLPQAS